MVYSVLRLALALTTPVLAGWQVTSRLREATLTERLSLAFGLGLGFIAIILTLFSLAGVALTSSLSYLITVIIWVAGLARLGLEISRRRGEPPVSRTPPRSDRSVLERSLQAVMLIVIVAMFASLGLRGMSTPLSSWDDRAIWGAKAKMLFYEKSVVSDGFTDRYRLHPHQNYPQLLPLGEHYIYSTVGRVSDRLVKPLFFLLFLALAGTLYGHVNRIWGTSAALGVVLVLVALPAFGRSDIGVPSGYADTPLTFFYGAGCVSILAWARGNDPVRLFTASLLLGMAALTKAEGLGLALIAFLPLFADPVLRRDNIRELLQASLLLVAIAAFWLGLRRLYPSDPENYLARLSINRMLAHKARLGTIARSYWSELFRSGNWNWLYPATVAGALLAASHSVRREVIYLCINILAALSMHTVIYLVSPWNVEVLLAITLTRLLMPLAVPAMLLVCYLLLPDRRTTEAA